MPADDHALKFVDFCLQTTSTVSEASWCQSSLWYLPSSPICRTLTQMRCRTVAIHSRWYQSLWATTTLTVEGPTDFFVASHWVERSFCRFAVTLLVFSRADHSTSHVVFTGRIAAKRQTAGTKFTHAKNHVFCLTGRLVAPIQVKLCRADGHLGPLGCSKFHLNHHRGWECGSKKYQKFPLFGKESPHRGMIWHDLAHRLQGYCWETARRSIRPNFSCTL